MEQTTTEGPKRPGFLKVLCILSFIGTGLGLVMGIMSWWTYNAAAKLMEGMGDLGSQMGDAMNNAGVEGGADAGAAMNSAMSEGMAMMGMDPHKQAMSALIVALLNIVVFAGAFMMWKLKKQVSISTRSGRLLLSQFRLLLLEASWEVQWQWWEAFLQLRSSSCMVLTSSTCRNIFLGRIKTKNPAHF